MTTEAQDFESRGRLSPVGHIKRFSRGAAGAASRLGGFLKGPATRRKRGSHAVASVSSGQLLGGQYDTEPEHGYECLMLVCVSDLLMCFKIRLNQPHFSGPFLGINTQQR